MKKPVSTFLLKALPFSLVLLIGAPVFADNVTYGEFSLEDVAKHNKADDCWLAVNGKVYDVTEYVGLHPASQGVLEQWCGSEATDGMETKGIGDDHSSDAYQLLENYLIGKIK